jgi:serine protease
LKLLKSRRSRLAAASVGLLAALVMSSGPPELGGPNKGGLEAPRPSLEVSLTSDPDGAGPRPEGPERVEGELVIDLQDELTGAELKAFAAEHGLSLRYSSEPGRLHNNTIATVPESEMAAVLERVSNDPRVESVDPNYIFQLTALPMEANAQASDDDFPNDPRYNEQWHMEMINAQRAWPISIGRDVVTAVIDTGVAYREFDDFHQVEDLDKTDFKTGYDFVNKRTEALDDQCHGTHVAGTIAQSTHNGKGVVGVAFGSRIMPVKVLSRSGSGTLADVADGVRFSADNGATVINMSLGGPFPSASLADAVAYAHNKGTIVVCAAGNSSTERKEYPAGFDEAVSVASVNRDEGIAWYSNRGDSISFAAPGGDTRNYGAAGGVLQNTIHPGNHRESNYFFFQGTSMAAPHAAGVAAMVASTGVTNPKTIEWVIQKTARPKDAPPTAGYGAGIMDAEAAVQLSGVTFKTVQLALALLFVAVAGVPMLRRKAFGLWALTVPTAVLASSGLYFLPLLFPCSTAWSNFWTLGLPSWSIPLMGAAHHGNPLFLSCLIPMLLSIIVVEKPALRSLVSGLSSGFAAHLLFAAALSTVSVLYVPAVLARLWLIANGLLCVFLAIVLAEEHP